MTIVQDASSSESVPFFFRNVLHAMWEVILQTAGSASGLFGTSRYEYVIAYALAITFIIAMPVLFNNFLVSTHKQTRFT